MPNDLKFLDNNKISTFIKFCINQYLNNKKVLIITEDKSRLTNLINFFEEDFKKHDIDFDVIKIENFVSSNTSNSFNFSISPYVESFEIEGQLVVFDRDIFGVPEKVL